MLHPITTPLHISLPLPRLTYHDAMERYGSDINHVIRTEVLLRTFAERDEMNAEYIRHFDPEHVPARLCFGDVGLAGQCKVEILVTAVKV